MNETEMNALIDAAEERAKLYDDDDRECIKADVMNAFFAGAEYARQAAPVDLATDPVVEANRQLLLDRSRVGMTKYGKPLEGTSLSHAELTQHALEEALDLANYLQATLRKLRAKPAAKYVDTWVGTSREGQGQLGVPLSEQNARWKKVETEDLAGAVWNGPNTASQVDPCMGLPAKGRG